MHGQRSSKWRRTRQHTPLRKDKFEIPKPRNFQTKTTLLPLTRPTEGQFCDLASVMARAIEQLKSHRRGSVDNMMLVRRTDNYGRKPEIYILGKNMFRGYRTVEWPDDRKKFLDELAGRTGTSQKAILTKLTSCELRERYDLGAGVMAVGATLGAQTTKLLVSERVAAANLIIPGAGEQFIRGIPYLNLGQIVVGNEIREELQQEVNGLVKGMDVVLRPLKTAH